jgi:hypothetical protein
MNDTDNDLIFALAERVVRALNMIQHNGEFELIATETNLDVRFVIALAVSSASAVVSA